MPLAAAWSWRFSVFRLVSDAIVLSFSCLCSPVVPLARSGEVSPLLLRQSVVQYNFRFFPAAFLMSQFASLFSPSLHGACQSAHAWNYRHVTGGSISISPLNINVYVIITINLYVVHKMIVGISCVLCNSNFILDYFLFSTLQTGTFLLRAWHFSCHLFASNWRGRMLRKSNRIILEILGLRWGRASSLGVSSSESPWGHLCPDRQTDCCTRGFGLAVSDGYPF